MTLALTPTRAAPFRKELEANGFAVLADVLPVETVEELAREIEAATWHAQRSSPARRHLIEAVPAARAVADSPAIRALVEPVLGPGAFIARSLFFDKTPEANWKVAWHQDITIAVREKIEVPGFNGWSVKGGVTHVQPPVAVLERMLTVRLHLDDCDLANGPLQVIPGSHQSGRFTALEISNWRRKRAAVPCTLRRGGVLLMRPLLLHASSPALEPRHRRVAHFEFAVDPLPRGLEWL